MRSRSGLGAVLLLALCGCANGVNDGTPDGSTIPVLPAAGSTIKTVVVIVMENHDWSSIAGSASAPYINGTLLPQASYATRYFGVRHPSEPNYLWMEGGTDFGITDDDDPSSHHLATHDHLVAQLDQAGISWKAYQEGIDGTFCPLRSEGFYAAKHNPFVFFDDVTDGNDLHSPKCISHIRPLSELATDLQRNTLPQYVFVTPNLCNDMHGAADCPGDAVRAGDAWLAGWIPQFQSSSAYASAAVVITWDENQGGDAPIGLIVLSPLAKGNAYSNSVRYTHSSLLRSLQEIFGVKPILGDAANATPLSDLFRSYP